MDLIICMIYFYFFNMKIYTKYMYYILPVYGRIIFYLSRAWYVSPLLIAYFTHAHDIVYIDAREKDYVDWLN